MYYYKPEGLRSLGYEIYLSVIGMYFISSRNEPCSILGIVHLGSTKALWSSHLYCLLQYTSREPLAWGTDSTCIAPSYILGSCHRRHQWTAWWSFQEEIPWDNSSVRNIRHKSKGQYPKENPSTHYDLDQLYKQTYFHRKDTCSSHCGIVSRNMVGIDEQRPPWPP
mmetsp:Transcript_17534/g.40838  ORF Transcript_17534/g.40838 Transcript_17534/m.40838 type:complete len:166 (-) Transcript_17534:214-711(-)